MERTTQASTDNQPVFSGVIKGAGTPQTQLAKTIRPNTTARVAQTAKNSPRLPVKVNTTQLENKEDSFPQRWAQDYRLHLKLVNEDY